MNIYRLLRICLQAVEILAASSYILLRFSQTLPKRSTGRKVLFATISFFSILTVVAIIFRSCNLGAWYLPVQTIEYTWVIILLELTISVLALDAFRLLLHISKKKKCWIKQHDIRIRRIYYPITILISCLIAVYGYIHFSNPVIKEVTFELNKPVPDWKIIAVSDIHCGTMSKKTLEKHIQTINEMHPDLVLLLGDQAVVNWKDLQKMGYADVFQQIQAKKGVYAINGNHEYIHGYVHNPDPEFRQWAKNFKIKTLEDRAITIDQQLVLIGRDDTSIVHRKKLNELCYNTDPTLPIIILDHSPLDLHSAQQIGADIQLSGHTHNGQVFPVNWIGQIKSRLKGGLFYGYTRKGQTQFYVTAGLGGSGAPIRIGTDGEIVVIKLKHTD